MVSMITRRLAAWSVEAWHTDQIVLGERGEIESYSLLLGISKKLTPTESWG